MYRLLLTALVAGCLVVSGCGEGKKPKKAAPKTTTDAPAGEKKTPAPAAPAKPDEKKPADKK